MTESNASSRPPETLPPILQIAPEIAPGSGVGGVAYQLEQQFLAAGVAVSRFTLAEARGAWLPEPGPGLRGRLALLFRVVWFSTIGTWLARRALAAAPTSISICHNDVLAGDIYVNHGILRAAMKARGHYLLRMLRNPLHLFTALRDAHRFRSRIHRVVVSLTTREAELLSSTYSKVSAESVVIANGVDIDRFTPPPAESRLAARAEVLPNPNPAATWLLFVGHEFDRKGLPLAIAALSQLSEPVGLLVVGGTPEMVVAAREQAVRAGVSEQVHLLGRLADPMPAFRAADCLVLPSAYEANALVVLEALAAGLPAIVTPVGYAPDLIRDGVNGFLVERTAAGVRQGIENYLRSDRRRLAEGARTSGEAHAWPLIAARYLELITRLAPDTRAPGSTDGKRTTT